MTACGQHHFEQSENIVFNKRRQNDVMAKAINDAMLRINDVLLLAKTKLRLRRNYNACIDLLPLLCYNAPKEMI